MDDLESGNNYRRAVSGACCWSCAADQVTGGCSSSKCDAAYRLCSTRYRVPPY